MLSNKSILTDMTTDQSLRPENLSKLLYDALHANMLLTKNIQGLGLLGNAKSATRKGSVQRSSIIATIERSSMDSETNVITNIVTIPKA